MTTEPWILVLDVEPGVEPTLASLFQAMPLPVRMAASEAEAARLSTADPPDLILVGRIASDQHRLELCARLRALPGLADTPMILAHHRSDPEGALRAFHAGAVDILPHPWLATEVHARLEAHLDRNRHKREALQRQAELEARHEELLGLSHRLGVVNEKLKRSEEMKGHFTAHIRNEINNPLSAILGLADRITPPGPPSDRCSVCASSARLIKAEALALDFHLRNIFHAADLEAGDLLPAMAMVDVPSLLSDVADSLVHAIERKSISLAWTLQPAGQRLQFPTDAGFVSTICANLLANAVEFGPTGSTVAIQAEVTPAGLSIAFIDQGPGIDAARHAEIFERFRQLESGLTRPHQGQGLGLAVSRALAELMNGQILLQSRPGEGSTFSLILPRPALDEDPATEAYDGNLFLFEDDSRAR